MENFIYVAVDKLGKKKKGTIEANNHEDAIKILQERGFIPITVNSAGLLNKEIDIKIFKSINLREIALFCRQMATMLRSGISLLMCLDVCRKQKNSKAFNKVLDEVFKDVEAGKPLSESMGSHKDIFPDILINMVESGEVSGTLDSSFEKMATYFEKQLRLRKKIVNALIYPVIVISVAIIVLVMLLIFVIPTFVGLFNDLGVELPSTTKFLILVSNFIRTKWFLLVIILLFLVGILKYISRTTRGKYVLDSIKLKMPLINKITLFSSLHNFSRTLSTLLYSGVPMIVSLNTSIKLINNNYIKNIFNDIYEFVKGGEALGEVLSSYEIFPPILTAMVKIGEETGNLDQMLEKVADYYENELDDLITRLMAVFEPIMIVLLAVIVGFMLSSIILPMFKIYSNIGI